MVGRQKTFPSWIFPSFQVPTVSFREGVPPNKKKCNPKRVEFSTRWISHIWWSYFSTFWLYDIQKTPWQFCENATFLGLWKRDPLKMVKFNWPTQRLGMKFGHGFAWGQVKKNCLYLMDRRLSIQSADRWCVLNWKNHDIPKRQSRSIKFSDPNPDSSGFASNTFGKVGKVLRFCRGDYYPCSYMGIIILS